MTIAPVRLDFLSSDLCLPGVTANSIHPITWVIDVPLATNGYMLRTMLKITLGASLLVGAMVSFLLAVQGDWQLIPPLLQMFILGGVGFFLIAVLIMLVAFGNRFRMRFTVGADGVRCETLDPVAKIGNRGALIVGVMAGRTGASGNGLLSITQENQALNWAGMCHADFDSVRHTIALRNRWRILMMIYCLPENYDAVRGLVSHCMTLHQTAKRSTGKSPVGSYLLRTVMVVLACVPVFVLGDVYDYDLFLPLLLMCFSIAMVWLVRHLAWVVLITSAMIVISMLTNALSMRQSSFFSVQSYRRFEVLSGDNWSLTVLGMVGILYLLWLATQILRERVRPALEADMTAGEQQ
jgi:hypothetical protein